MSDLVVTSKEIYSVKGLDRGDLNLLVSGLSRIRSDLEQHELDKATDLMEVLK